MSSMSISNTFQELFTAPLHAVVEAEFRYLAIWADWLRKKIKLLENAQVDLGNLSAQEITDLLEQAPIIKLDGVIDTAITMRIASVRESGIKGEGGLRVGPIYGGVSFATSKRSTEESVFQASASYTITNNTDSLSSFLSKNKLTPTSAAELKALSDKLSFASNLDLPELGSGNAPGGGSESGNASGDSGDV